MTLEEKQALYEVTDRYGTTTMDEAWNELDRFEKIAVLGESTVDVHKETYPEYFPGTLEHKERMEEWEKDTAATVRVYRKMNQVS